MFGLNWKISGGDPRAHRHEIGGAWGGYTKMNDGLASGLVAGTRVATALGWRPVEAITEGDEVLTFDSGMQRVTRVLRGVLWSDQSACPERLWPLYIPAEAIGNAQAFTLLPEAAVMIESDAADVALDDPFALVMAEALEGFRGIERLRPTQEIEVVQLIFDQDEVVFASHGALAFCPRVELLDLRDLMADEHRAPTYRALSQEDATLLINCMRADDLPPPLLV